MTDQTPATAAGRALVLRLASPDPLGPRSYAEDILEIERQACALGRDALARALERLFAEPTTDIRTTAARTLFDKAKRSRTQEVTITAQALRVLLPAIETQAVNQIIHATLLAAGFAVVPKDETWADHRTRCHDDNPDAVIAHLHETYNKAEAEIARLRAALGRFGRHTSQCRSNQTGRDEPDCNCGLRAALAGGSDATD